MSIIALNRSHIHLAKQANVAPLHSKVAQVVKRAFFHMYQALNTGLKNTHIFLKKVVFFYYAGSLSDYIFKMPRRHETIADFSSHLNHEGKLQFLDKAIILAKAINHSSCYAGNILKMASQVEHAQYLSNALKDLANCTQRPIFPKLVDALAFHDHAQRLAIIDLLILNNRFLKPLYINHIISDIQQKSLADLRFIFFSAAELNLPVDHYPMYPAGDLDLYAEIARLSILPVDEREEIIRLTRDNAGRYSTSIFKRRILLTIKAQIHQREAFLEQEDFFPPAPQARVGLDVHTGSRDDHTLKAIKRLVATYPSLTKKTIDSAYEEILAYISADSKHKAYALKALKEPRSTGAHFGPLVGEANFTLKGYEINGKEFIVRLWIFANSIQDLKERANAKFGILKALYDSVEAGGRVVCNQGKIQRLVVAVLQGRIDGINIESHDLGQITSADALNMFFLNEQNQKIQSLEQLLKAAESFCSENPRVVKESFIEAILQYATLEDMT
jgi:hypothetical protein